MSGRPRLSWMDAKYDDDHKAEVAPLFGTGQLSLMEDPPDAESGLNSPTESKSEDALASPANYGATDNEEKEEGEGDHTVITNVSNASSKQTASLASTATSNADKPAAKSNGKEESPSKLKKPKPPGRFYLLEGFRLIETWGVITSLLLLSSQLIPLFFLTPAEIGLTSMCLKLYLSLFCILFVVVEWDLPVGFLRGSPFLQTYFSRGFLYSFIGLSAVDEAYSERLADMIAHARDQFHVSWFSLFMNISAWMMLALGFVYMVLGACCLKALRDKLKRDQKAEWAAYKEAMRVYRYQNA